MSSDFYIKLTLAVYKVTALFPKEAGLKRDIRQAADEILVGLLVGQHENRSRDIKALQGYFQQAQAQNWVDERNFAVLFREYGKIEQPMGAGKTVEKPWTTQKRKKRILETIEKNNKIKVGDLIKIFPATNRRTILRDLEDFSQTGLIVKTGNGRGACYILRNATL